MLGTINITAITPRSAITSNDESLSDLIELKVVHCPSEVSLFG
jgi:hypothetical protein